MRVTVITLLLVLVSLPILAQDPTVVSSEYYSVLLENDHLRVIEFKLPVGEEDQWHAHPDSLIFYLTTARVSVSKPEGKIITATLKEHTVFYQPAGEHQVKNIGDVSVHAVSFELKQPVGGLDSVELSPAEVAPDTNSMLLDNDRVRVVYTTTPPGNPPVLHQHIQMAVFAASDAVLRITPEGGEPRELSITKGSVIWSPPVRHTVENIGTEPVVLLHVEIK